VSSKQLARAKFTISTTSVFKYMTFRTKKVQNELFVVINVNILRTEGV
jgi:hypothetical protein